MTNENLRALLAEARELLSKWCWSGTCCELRVRIDTALAEVERLRSIKAALLEQRRERIAIEAMQGLLASYPLGVTISAESLAKESVMAADALIAELDRDKP